MRVGRAWQPFARLTPASRRLTVALASLLLLVPMAHWLASRHAAWAGDRLRGRAALSAARSWYLEDLSSQLRRMGRTEASAEVAKRARSAGLAAKPE
jgi:hypothetical protein